MSAAQRKHYPAPLLGPLRGGGPGWGLQAGRRSTPRTPDDGTCSHSPARLPLLGYSGLSRFTRSELGPTPIVGSSPAAPLPALWPAPCERRRPSAELVQLVLSRKSPALAAGGGSTPRGPESPSVRPGACPTASRRSRALSGAARGGDQCGWARAAHSPEAARGGGCERGGPGGLR